MDARDKEMKAGILNHLRLCLDPKFVEKKKKLDDPTVRNYWIIHHFYFYFIFFQQILDPTTN